MADNVNLPLTGTGDSIAKVATDDAGANGHVQLVKLAISADGSVVLIPADASGIYIQPRLDDPQTQQLIASSIGPGGTANLDADDIPGGKTGKLLGVDVGSSVPFRWDIQTVSGGRTTRTTLYTYAGETVPWRAPFGDKFITLAGGSGIHFGLAVTSLSANSTADARATMYWDEQ